MGNGLQGYLAVTSQRQTDTRNIPRASSNRPHLYATYIRCGLKSYRGLIKKKRSIRAVSLFQDVGRRHFEFWNCAIVSIYKGPECAQAQVCQICSKSANRLRGHHDLKDSQDGGQRHVEFPTLQNVADISLGRPHLHNPAKYRRDPSINHGDIETVTWPQQRPFGGS